MKAAFTFICMCCAIAVTAQHTRYNWRQASAGWACSFFAGNANGLHETINYHYNRFEGRFPNANKKYWDPQESWKNKYRAGNPELGARFPGSTTLFVWTTDAKHLLSSSNRIGIVSGTVFATIGERRPWWHYAINLAGNYLCYSAGFHLQYSIIFAQKK